MATPGVQIETLRDPARYTTGQIDKALVVAATLGRGKLVLVEPPMRPIEPRD